MNVPSFQRERHRREQKSLRDPCPSSHGNSFRQVTQRVGIFSIKGPPGPLRGSGGR